MWGKWKLIERFFKSDDLFVMRTSSHFLMTVVVLLTFAPLKIGPWLYGLAGGVLIDLDHVYTFVKKYGIPRSRKELSKIMKEHFECEDERNVPRLRTILQEPMGFAVLSFIAYILDPWLGTMCAIPALWGHFILDAISVRVMPFEPFSRREYYIGWLDPSAHPRRVAVFNMLLVIVIVLQIFFIRKDVLSIILSVLKK